MVSEERCELFFTFELGGWVARRATVRFSEALDSCMVMGVLLYTTATRRQSTQTSCSDFARSRYYSGQQSTTRDLFDL
jgi:hypothetical protein